MSRVALKKVGFWVSYNTPCLIFGWLSVPSTHRKPGNHYASDNSSGTTPPRNTMSGTQKNGGRSRRLGAEIGKYMRNLSRHISVTAMMKMAGKREIAAEKPTLETEMIDREEEVTVHDGCVPYVVSRPIPKGKVLRKVVVTVVSKDQGWSNYLGDYDTYRNSWTWFELSVGPSKDSGEKWRGVVVRNLHAHGDFKEHTIEMTDRELYERANSGDVLTVWALARFSDWVNTVKKVTIRYIVE